MVLRLRQVSSFLIPSFVVAWWLFGDTYARHFLAPSTNHAIRFAHFGGYEDYELWRSVISGYNDSLDTLASGTSTSRVIQEYVVGLAGHYETKLRQQILSRTLPDVVLIQLDTFRALGEHFTDLTDVLDAIEHIDSLNDQAVAAFRFGNQQRGLPLSGGNLQIYVNTRCFERVSRHYGDSVSLPRDDWTMADFHQIARALTCDFDADGRIDQFGFWLPRWIYYLPFLWSFGADITNTSGSQWLFTGPQAEQAVQFYRSLAVDDRVCPRDEEVPQLFQDVGFLTGKVAMCVNGPWFEPFLKRTRLADSYRVYPIPRGPTGSVTRMTWDGVVVAPDLSPERRAAAGRFIRHLLSATVQDRIASTGRALPARSASLSAFVGVPPDPRRRPFVDALTHSRLHPAMPDFRAVDRVINECLAKLVDPESSDSPRDLLRKLADNPVIIRAFSSGRITAETQQ